MTLKLYDCATAPSPRRARIFLAEKGIEWHTVEIDLRTGEQLSEDYTAKVPRAIVPALEIGDGTIITENLAIAAYVEAIHPSPPLMGKTALQKARVLEWNWRCEMDGLSAVAEILRNSSKHMKGRAMTGPRNVEQIEALPERGRKRLGWFFEDLEARLQESDFVAGDFYSLADITATVIVDFSAWVKAAPGDDYPSIQAYMTRMRARPSYSL